MGYFVFRNSGFGFHRVSGRWWAWMELNHRPHAYQACALTELSYRPIRMRNYEFGFQIGSELRTPRSEFGSAQLSIKIVVREPHLISQN